MSRPTCCWALLLLLSIAARAHAAAPNIVLVLADDMGIGDPGCYNPGSRCSTPHIDRLASEGLRFTDAHAAGAWCTPSRYGILTGRYAFRTELAWQRQPVIAEDTPTVAATLKTAGYQTAMVGKWHLGFVDADRPNYNRAMRGGPTDRGFDTFFGLHTSLDIPDYYWIHNDRVLHEPTVPIEDHVSPEYWSSVQGAFWRGGKRGADFDMDAVLDHLGAAAVERVEAMAQEEAPYFLYVPLTSPHTPWLPSEEFAESDGAGLYSQFVAHTDGILGRILEAVDASGEAENTIVIFTSDNGPVWYPRDIQRFGHDSMGGYRGMKGDVWEAGHRMPFVVRWPAEIESGRVSDALMSFVDVHATLASIAGAKVPESALDSLDFAAHWMESSALGPRHELVTFQSPVALRSGDWKLVTQTGSLGFLSHRPEAGGAFLQRDELNPETGDASIPQGQLYNLAVDPSESHNLWNGHPDRIAAMRARLAEIVAAE